MASVLPTKSYASVDLTFPMPDLIEVQFDSFKRLKEVGLGDLFDEVSPIESYNKGMKLYFPGTSPEAQEWELSYRFAEPKNTIEECVERDLTYSAPLYVSVLLAGSEIAEPNKMEIFLGDFPEMTPQGTFIINGTERVVVSQLIRSPGVYFESDVERTSGHRLAMAKLIPDRGAWMEFETRKNDYLILKYNRRRTVPITIFLRALAVIEHDQPNAAIKEGTDEELFALFGDVDTDEERKFIESTIHQEPEWDLNKAPIGELALLEFFKRMRPGDPVTHENAMEFVNEQLFDHRHYDLELVGRYKLNQKLDLDEKVPMNQRMLTGHDIVALVRRMIEINNGMSKPDDIDHLGNRRVKTVGELIQNKLRVGMRRMERVIKERMSINDQTQVSPVSLVNIRPVVASLREFFGSSQLSQFMDQTNPLSELRHKRTLSALGPGGLHRERAGLDVRDVHNSHYGRVCPIETPEGPNIGLIGRLANFARVNAYGFIETPYRHVLHSLMSDDERLIGRQVIEDVLDADGNVILEKDTRVSEKDFKALKKLNPMTVFVRTFVSEEIRYLSADKEDKFVIALATTPLNEHLEFIPERVSVRSQSEFTMAASSNVNFIDVAPNQVVGISASLIPFLSHDDANRALMGSNMQTQSVPLLIPEIPMVSTGMEDYAASDSGQIVTARHDGEVISCTGKSIVVRTEGGNVDNYQLRKYQRSNQSTCIDQRPAVTKGQFVKKGDILADSSSTVDGNLALGQNPVIAFLSWEGGNFEDAILISERLVQEDKFTSVHIEKYEVEARDTKLGPEEITRDIPNVGEDAIKDLDEEGIIRVGAEVGPNDILVGKITPKGEKELTPEERLLRAIFGEKSRDVKDTSLRMKHGEHGKVVDVKVFTREDNQDLSAGVDTMVRVSVAQCRKITAGDKMAGRHGNKGVVSLVVPVEDMPFLEDGTPVDIILNPLGVPGRMNIGQVLETHLGWAARQMGFRAITPVFDGASEHQIEAELGRAWLTDHAWKESANMAWEWINEMDYDPEMLEDDDEVRLLYLSQWLEGKDVDILRMKSDYHYARQQTVNRWLEYKGYDPSAVMNPGERATFTDQQDEYTILVVLRLWLEAKGEDVSKLKDDEILDYSYEFVKRSGNPMPTLGKTILRNGKTGEKFDHPVTVGVMTMLKLHHLVEDKVHARSTGPYSLVTQQPLGGKAQFGGQRFGEMEVWALQAYGAAYTLQEVLTIKSDDTTGRVAAYESIVKSKPIEEPGLPASFRVLVKELQSLGLSVEGVLESGEVVRFGKDEENHKSPHLTTGIMGYTNK
ncbi:MAG: DNA-directed RNA polymerase subunit beta [Anaerolineae bacterium]|jgi:DNA-directed RNA polymerase subunit beta|nr:DNA-directed RNA polymerase subunit beta [Anaerolineae bacterium]